MRKTWVCWLIAVVVTVGSALWQRMTGPSHPASGTVLIGGQTIKLKFGHHSGNHPVRDCASGKALITAQNHNYCVTPGDLNPDEVEITYKSLNDDSLEGIRLKNKPVFSVQFHPEAAPGPHDAHDIFAEFFQLMKNAK